MAGVLVLAYKYLGRTSEALIANANLGGDNCHRGSLLGAILGAAGVAQIDQKAAVTYSNLKNDITTASTAIVDKYVTAVVGTLDSKLDALLEAGSSLGIAPSAFASEDDDCAT